MCPDLIDENVLMEWVSLGSVLTRCATRLEYAAVYDAINSGGIFSLDDFNRPRQVKPNAEEADSASRLVLNVWNHEAGNDMSFADVLPPMDGTAGFPDDPFVLFGWPRQYLPNFQDVDAVGSFHDQSLKQHAPSNQRLPILPESDGQFTEKIARVSDMQRRLDTQLVIIEALLSRLGIKRSDRGTAARIREAVEDLGIKMDEETTKKVLDSIKEAVEKRLPG